MLWFALSDLSGQRSRNPTPPKRHRWITPHICWQRLLKYISGGLAARLQPEPLVCDPLPPSIPPPPRHTPSPPGIRRQDRATLNSASHPPPVSSCSPRYRVCHTHKRTVHSAHASPFVSASAPPLPHTHTHKMNEMRRWRLLWLKQKIPCQGVGAEIRGRKYEGERIKGVCSSVWRWLDE